MRLITLIAIILLPFSMAYADVNYGDDGVSSCTDELLVGRADSALAAANAPMFDLYDLSSGPMASALARGGEDWGPGRRTTSVAMGEIDGDGRHEFVVTRNRGPNARFFVYEARAGGGVTLLQQGGQFWDRAYSATDAAFGDVDGDGGDELLIVRDDGGGEGGFRWFLFKWTGGAYELLWAGGRNWGDGRAATAAAMGDIDQDGRDEFVIGRDEGSNARFFAYEWNPADTKIEVIASHGAAWSTEWRVSDIAIGDVTGDGADNVLVGRAGDRANSQKFAVYDFRPPDGDNAAGAFTRIAGGGNSWNADQNVSAIETGDLNHDGVEEFVVGRTRGPGSRFMLMNLDHRDNTLSVMARGGEHWPPERAVMDIAMGDMNGDFLEEIAVASFGGPPPPITAPLPFPHFPFPLLLPSVAAYKWNPDGNTLDLFTIGEITWAPDQRATAVALRPPAGPKHQDRDGDGLRDKWETDGIDTDCDGAVDYDLSSFGVDPDRKNLLVEIDYMENHQPRADDLTRIANTFANAPVDNPDGSTGIDATFIVDQQLDEVETIEHRPYLRDRRSDSFGTSFERGDANRDALLTGKAFSFRYGIYGHQFYRWQDEDVLCDDGISAAEADDNDCIHEDDVIDTRDDEIYGPGSNGGVAPDRGNFLVTMGAKELEGSDDPLHPNGMPRRAAGTLIHEIGHTIGLKHGGGDDENLKPNYLSVMNYFFSSCELYRTEYQRENLKENGLCTYSSEKLRDLDEEDLDETTPLTNQLLMTAWRNPDDNREIIFSPAYRPINWDNRPPNATGVIVNINHHPSGDGEDMRVLTGFNDWKNIRLGIPHGIIGRGEERAFRDLYADGESEGAADDDPEKGAQKKEGPKDRLQTKSVEGAQKEDRCQGLNSFMPCTTGGPERTLREEIADLACWRGAVCKPSGERGYERACADPFLMARYQGDQKFAECLDRETGGSVRTFSAACRRLKAADGAECGVGQLYFVSAALDACLGRVDKCCKISGVRLGMSRVGIVREYLKSAMPHAKQEGVCRSITNFGSRILDPNLVQSDDPTEKRPQRPEKNP